MQGKVRLIAGKWRSRKLGVLNVDDLRPTPDRARETLFNWLSPYIEGADCLDLFAGTGALGFEALSRGASSVVMVEHNKDIVNNIMAQAKMFEATGLEVVFNDALTWLDSCQKAFDIVFIDPPYHANLLERSLEKLLACGCVNNTTLIYVESDKEINIENEQLEMIKSGNAGKVIFKLIACKPMQ
ncbi:MAG: 16S rRNA (guanine(966)-N(2))-methyltransferase RsmD [Gammaproteobacteria bacterium]|nr:16S rRNA (guanine(966)-N(2))-methyltransferase RsmD [Gammaproteobacteria bacterium]